MLVVTLARACACGSYDMQDIIELVMLAIDPCCPDAQHEHLQTNLQICSACTTATPQVGEQRSCVYVARDPLKVSSVTAT